MKEVKRNSRNHFLTMEYEVDEVKHRRSPKQRNELIISHGSPFLYPMPLIVNICVLIKIINITHHFSFEIDTYQYRYISVYHFEFIDIFEIF